MLRRFVALTLRFPLSSSDKKLLESPTFVQSWSCVQPSSIRRFLIRSPTLLGTPSSLSGGDPKRFVNSLRNQCRPRRTEFQLADFLTSCFANYIVGRNISKPLCPACAYGENNGVDGMSRKNVSEKEMKALLALSGGISAFPNCKTRLVEPGNAADDAAFLGEMGTSSATAIRGHGATSRCRMTTGTSTPICCCSAAITTRP